MVSRIKLMPMVAVACSVSGVAFAGSCPEDHVLSAPRELKQAPDIGIGREVLARVDLTGWRDMGNFKLRLRKLVIEAGGVVPTHGHGDRPSIVHVLDGELIEHNAFCYVPIVHKAGDTTPESGPGHIHWWENKTDKTVIVFSADVVPFKAPNSSAM